MGWQGEIQLSGPFDPGGWVQVRNESNQRNFGSLTNQLMSTPLNFSTVFGMDLSIWYVRTQSGQKRIGAGRPGIFFENCLANSVGLVSTVIRPSPKGICSFKNDLSEIVWVQLGMDVRVNVNHVII